MNRTLRKSDLRTARTGYLYPDGHLVLVHEKLDKRMGMVEWVTIHEKVVNAEFSEGRIIFHEPALPLLLVASSVGARAESLEGGSQNTRAKRQAVGHVSFRLPPAKWPLIIHTTPDIVGDVSYQWTAQVEEFNPLLNIWSTHRVVGIVEQKGAPAGAGK